MILFFDARLRRTGSNQFTGAENIVPDSPYDNGHNGTRLPGSIPRGQRSAPFLNLKVLHFVFNARDRRFENLVAPVLRSCQARSLLIEVRRRKAAPRPCPVARLEPARTGKSRQDFRMACCDR